MIVEAPDGAHTVTLEIVARLTLWLRSICPATWTPGAQRPWKRGLWSP